MSIDFLKSLYYEFLSYFVPQKIRYEIKGECKRCGKCCQEIRAYGLKNEKEFRIMQFIFPHYRYFYIYKKDEQGNLVLSCKHLNKDGHCGIYKIRPLLCRNYPLKKISFNGEMIDGCGYRVIKKEFKDFLK